MAVKLMVCTTDSKQNAHECWKQTFLICKTNNFSKRVFFFSSTTRFFKQQSYRTFTQIFFELLMFRTDLKNLYNKNFFPSYWPKLWNKSFSLMFFLCKKKNQTTSTGQRKDAPSLLTVQSQALNLWEEFFSPQEGMTAPPRLKNYLTDPRLSPIQGTGIRVLSLSRPLVSAC